jgi:hypothetical protein
MPRTKVSVPAKPLFFVVVHGHRLQIFCFDDQAAVQTFDIIDAVTPGDNDGTVVFTNGWHGLHKDGLGFILTASPDLSSPKIQGFCPSSEFGRRGRSRFSAASDIAGHR